jgi:hypothetical protein
MNIFGKPGSKGRMLSKYAICSSERDSSSDFTFASRCSTFLPPIIGTTFGALCRTYAIATDG